MEKRIKKDSGLFLDHGRIPPQAVDVEEAVLGACMLESLLLDRVLDIISPEMFYKESNQKIFRAIVNLYKANDAVDILTVTQMLMKSGDLESAGGPYGISLLTNRVATSFNVEDHAKIVAQKFMAREAIRITSEAQRLLYDESEDVFDVISKAESSLNSIADLKNRLSTRRMADVVMENIESLTERAEQIKKGIDIKISTGFVSLDKATGGLHPGDLTIVAARPGMGKTAFALSLLRNVSLKHGKPSLFFSLEVSNEQVANRMISMESGINLSKIRDVKLDDSDFMMIGDGVRGLLDGKIFVDDTPALSLLELKTKSRRMKNMHKIEVIFVDYLQLMTGDREQRGNREQEISSISRALKALAKELKVPVIALSQLSRSVETRGGDKRPQLSDLRESGAIEQDADNVAFLYRPEYYKILEDENGDSTEGLVEFLIRKQRHGETGDLFLNFTPENGRFYDRSLAQEPIFTQNERFDSQPF